MNPPPAAAPASSAPRIELLYEDAHLVIANKPSGLLVHRGWARDDDTALFRVRDAVGGWVYPLHRLDRGTSGALLFARTKAAAAPLGALFQNGLIRKSYLALVRGVPPAEGTIDYAIPRSEDGERVPAVTHFRLIAASSTERCALVEASPETGRLHQVRRHLCHIGHPLVGDVKHGRGDINRKYRVEYQLQRLALHAYRVSFEHPFTKRPLIVSAELPLDLAGPLLRLGLPTALPALVGSSAAEALRSRV